MTDTPQMAFDYAFDRSVRNYDKAGHLRIDVANVSKSNVCGYYGAEIPHWRELGLDEAKLYQLYRDPAELAAACDTINGKPLIYVHKAMTADDHDKEVVIGCVGTDAHFEEPYLKASLTVWAGDGINLIETEEQRELSPGYYYDADMTPGITDGLQFDGVMRNIHFNHLALVKEGRTGPDVVVGDSKPETFSMKLKPRKSASLQAIILALDGVPAEGIDLTPIELAMDAAEAAESEDEDPDAEDEDPDAEDEEPEIKAMDAKAVQLAVDKAVAKALKAVNPAKTVAKAVETAVVAMDAKYRDIDAAKIAVRPFVGEVTGAVDSADDVYALALDAAGVKHEGVTGKGLACMVAMLGNTALPEPALIALDTASGDPFAEFK